MSDTRGRPAPETDDAAARAVALLKVGAPLAVAFLALGVGLLRGVPLAILVLAAGALAAVIALFWQSVRTLVGETPLSGADAFAIAAPRVEEEKKRAVLRALKDLEFEKSVGKISAADYDHLVLQYRAQARSLLQQLDEGARPRRDRVLALVDARLRQAGLAGGLAEARDAKGAAAAPSTDAGPREADDVKATGEANDEAGEHDASRRARADGDDANGDDAAEGDARATCAACAASNEIDAAFCKKCGAKMTPAEEPADAS